jgi:DNA (cytosine-5)-methyltransferase 1
MKEYQEKKKPVFIDLFAGAGGMSIGYEKAGFKLVAATDWDHWCCETLKANHKDSFVYEGDIEKIDLDDFSGKLPVKEIDLIVGGPPCQGFSQLGKREKTDPRNQLWRQYMRFVAYFRPKVFVIENVPQLLTSEEYPQIKEYAEKLGYIIKEKVLHAVDYGAPQKRKRAIVIGSRIGAPVHPEPTHVNGQKISLLTQNLKPWKTVRDAIGDLPLIPNSENWHIGRNPTPMSLMRYKAVPPGGNRFDLPIDLTPECWKRKVSGSTDVFGRLEWDKPSLTIRTEFYKPEKGRYLHPEAHRPITIREAARLQTFPDDYVFVGSKVQVAKQIGNAVPCELAYEIGLQLMKLINPRGESLNYQTIDSFSPFTCQAV